MMRLVAISWALLACAPAKPPALRVMTLNIASGAGDRFRTPDARARQEALLTDADLAALQEVDVDVERSGRINTAIAVAGSAFGSCAATPDGVSSCSGDAGTVIFGRSFQGDDVFAADDSGVPSGIIDGDSSLNTTGTDRSSTALFGNALLVRHTKVESSVVIALPISSGRLLDEYETLASAPISTLAAHNLAIRSTRGIEPRSVLVVRLANGLSVLVTHFEGGSQAALRATQLSAAIVIAAAERRSGRQVLLLGDFNMSPTEAEAMLTPAGFVLSVGSALDQIWADSSLTISDAMERATEGASDHPFAPAVTVLPVP